VRSERIAKEVEALLLGVSQRAAIGEGVDGSPRRKWAAMHTAMAEITEQNITVEMRRHSALLICETDFGILN
jgi:hypothetical protein